MLKEMNVLPGFLCFFKAPCWLKKKKVHIPKLVHVFWCLWHGEGRAGSRASRTSSPVFTIGRRSSKHSFLFTSNWMNNFSPQILIVS